MQQQQASSDAPEAFDSAREANSRGGVVWSPVSHGLWQALPSTSTDNALESSAQKVPSLDMQAQSEEALQASSKEHVTDELIDRQAKAQLSEFKTRELPNLMSSMMWAGATLAFEELELYQAASSKKTLALKDAVKDTADIEWASEENKVTGQNLAAWMVAFEQGADREAAAEGVGERTTQDQSQAPMLKSPKGKDSVRAFFDECLRSHDAAATADLRDIANDESKILVASQATAGPEDASSARDHICPLLSKNYMDAFLWELFLIHDAAATADLGDNANDESKILVASQEKEGPQTLAAKVTPQRAAHVCVFKAEWLDWSHLVLYDNGNFQHYGSQGEWGKWHISHAKFCLLWEGKPATVFSSFSHLCVFRSECGSFVLRRNTAAPMWLRELIHIHNIPETAQRTGPASEQMVALKIADETRVDAEGTEAATEAVGAKKMQEETMAAEKNILTKVSADSSLNGETVAEGVGAKKRDEEIMTLEVAVGKMAEGEAAVQKSGASKTTDTKAADSDDKANIGVAMKAEDGQMTEERGIAEQSGARAEAATEGDRSAKTEEETTAAESRIVTKVKTFVLNPKRVTLLCIFQFNAILGVRWSDHVHMYADGSFNLCSVPDGRGKWRSASPGKLHLVWERGPPTCFSSSNGGRTFKSACGKFVLSQKFKSVSSDFLTTMTEELRKSQQLST